MLGNENLSSEPSIPLRLLYIFTLLINQRKHVNVRPQDEINLQVSCFQWTSWIVNFLVLFAQKHWSQQHKWKNERTKKKGNKKWDILPLDNASCEWTILIKTSQRPKYPNDFVKFLGYIVCIHRTILLNHHKQRCCLCKFHEKKKPRTEYCERTIHSVNYNCYPVYPHYWTHSCSYCYESKGDIDQKSIIFCCCCTFHEKYCFCLFSHFFFGNTDNSWCVYRCLPTQHQHVPNLFKCCFQPNIQQLKIFDMSHDV